MGLEWAAQLLNVNICYGVYTHAAELVYCKSHRDSSAHWRESEVIDVTVYACTLHIHRKVVYTIELEKLSYPILPVDSTYFSSNLRVQSKADRRCVYTTYLSFAPMPDPGLHESWVNISSFLSPTKKSMSCAGGNFAMGDAVLALGM